MLETNEDRSLELTRMADIEEELAASLREAADQIAHAECFDLEQRAEVYSILRALQADSAAHRQIVGEWINDTTGVHCHV